MKPMETQGQRPTLNELYSKGWTLTQAARELGVSHSHLSRVLNDDDPRTSERLVDRVKALPKRRLRTRKPAATR